MLGLDAGLVSVSHFIMVFHLPAGILDVVLVVLSRWVSYGRVDAFVKWVYLATKTSGSYPEYNN